MYLHAVYNVYSFCCIIYTATVKVVNLGSSLLAHYLFYAGGVADDAGMVGGGEMEFALS